MVTLKVVTFKQHIGTNPNSSLNGLVRALAQSRALKTGDVVGVGLLQVTAR